METGNWKHDNNRFCEQCLVGPSMFKSYSYEELYFLDGAKRVRDRVNGKVCYIGGVSTL
jgi:hypothetical protein